MKLHVYLNLEIDILKTLVIRFSKIILTLKTNLSVRWTQVCYGWLALINNWQPSWCMVFLWWGLSLYSNLLAHPARAYPSFHVTWSDEEYHYSPLEGMLVHVEVPPYSISSGFPDNLLLPIYTPWVESSTVRVECLPKKTTHWPGKSEEQFPKDTASWPTVGWQFLVCFRPKFWLTVSQHSADSW